MESYDVELVGDINYEAYHKRLTDTVFNIHAIVEDKKQWKAVFNELYTYMKQGYEQEKVRKHPVQFRFSTDNAEQIKTMPVTHFIVNLIIWNAFRKLDKVQDIGSPHIFDGAKITEDYIADYINHNLIAPYHKEVDIISMNEALDDMIYALSQIFTDFGILAGTTMDMESFIELAQRYPRFREILHTKLDDTLQPKEIEDTIFNSRKEFLDIIVNDEDNHLKPFLVTGAGINTGQLQEFAISGGLKPDVEGNVIPVPINSNYIAGGLNSINNFYIDGQAGPKALIMNSTVMGKSGHFSYKTMILTSSYNISKTVDDCDTKRLIELHVTNRKVLKKINGRYYRLPDEDSSVLHVVNMETDEHLIGKTILMRSPVTCTAHDGICHKCYGDLYYINNTPSFHAGRFAATQTNNPIQQKILSTKHMLKTNSDKVEFSADFYRFFALDANKIIFNMDSKEDLSQWFLQIRNEDLYTMDDISSSDFNDHTEIIYLRNKDTDEMIPIQEIGKPDDPRELYLFSDVSKHLKPIGADFIGIKLSALDIESPIAMINIVNNEVSKPLKNIIRLLDKKDHYNCTTIDEMVNAYNKLTIDSGMSVDSVHTEMILKGLIRSTEDILQPPAFNNEEKMNDYQILTVSKALAYSPSIALSLSFEELGRQFVKPSTYNKYRKSDYDIFFKEEIKDEAKKYNRAQKQYNEIMKELKLRKLASKELPSDEE